MKFNFSFYQIYIYIIYVEHGFPIFHTISKTKLKNRITHEAKYSLKHEYFSIPKTICLNQKINKEK